MTEVIWIDGGVDGWARRDYVHATAGKRVFKNGEHGKVVPRICGWIWGKEGTGITDKLRSDTAR